MWEFSDLSVAGGRRAHRLGARRRGINVSKAEPSLDPDAVAFFTEGKSSFGLDTYAVAHGGGTYRFESQATSMRSPGKFEPAYGGFRAHGAALAKKFDGDPRYWKIVDGKLYLNPEGRHSGRMVQGHCRQYRQGPQHLEPHPRHRRSEALVVAGIASFGSTARGRSPSG
jgi:hypothetical protein